MENDTDDTIVVILDLSEKPFPCIENERLGRLDDRWPLVANVAWCGVFEGGLLDGGGAEKLAEPVETDLLGDIELQKNVNGARECKGLRHELDLIQHSVKDIAAHGDEKEAGLFGERVETKPKVETELRNTCSRCLSQLTKVFCRPMATDQAFFLVQSFSNQCV
jgi:hypothetical protein